MAITVKKEHKGWKVIARIGDDKLSNLQVGFLKVTDEILPLELEVTSPQGKTFKFKEELISAYFADLDKWLKVRDIPHYSAAAYDEYGDWRNGIEIYLKDASLYVLPDGSTIWED